MAETEAGLTIAEARKRKGLTQAQLGDIVGVQSTQVSHWETGMHAVPRHRVAAVADALDLTEDEVTSISTPSKRQLDRIEGKLDQVLDRLLGDES